MVYLSFSARILLNLEALNMTESVGNFVRHRRAPIVVPTSNGYILKYVPVISGESLAHAYQEILADVAVKAGLPVCLLCRQGVFLKHTDKNVFRESGVPAPSDPKDPVKVEEAIVKHCVVEDVGGFLYTDATLKRTSRFMVGYMIPAMDSIRSSAAEAQFHVRYNPLSTEAQSIYNVEAGSALYTLNAGLDLDGIGVSGVQLENGEPKLLVSHDERVKRIEAALKSLELLVTQQLFGAKRSRFMPQWRIMSLVITVSHPLPFNTMPGHDKNYILETISNAEKLVESLRNGVLAVDQSVSAYYYSGEKISEPSTKGLVEVYKASSPVEAFDKAISKAVSLVKG